MSSSSTLSTSASSSKVRALKHENMHKTCLLIPDIVRMLNYLLSADNTGFCVRPSRLQQQLVKSKHYAS